MYRSNATSVLFILAITSSVVLLFARAFGDSVQAIKTQNEALPAQTSASTPDLDRDPFLVADTVASLHGIHVDSTDAKIPFAAKPLLTTLKHQLRDLIANRLSVEGSKVSTQQLQARVIVDLNRSGVIVTEPACVIVDQNYVDNGYDYGDIYDITMKRPHDCFDLIAVKTTIGVLCGQDTSLYLFKFENQSWKLILATEANDYDLISGAQGNFEFDVSWPDSNGEFFVVTASVNPWCTSNWQAITYRVLRPGQHPYEARELLNRKNIIWLIDDLPYRLDVRGTGFTLSFHDERYLDLQNNGEDVSIDDPKGMSIIKYTVEGNSVKRKD